MPALKLGHCVMSSWGHRSPCLMASRAACALAICSLSSAQDGGDEPGRRLGVAALPANPGRRGEQADFLVVPQGRGGDARAAGQLADGKQAAGRVDFRCT